MAIILDGSRHIALGVPCQLLVVCRNRHSVTEIAADEWRPSLSYIAQGKRYLMNDARQDADDVCRRFEQSMQQLIEAIAEAPCAMQGSLLAAARQRLDGAQLNVPPTPAISRRSRALRRKFERGMEIERRIDEGRPVTDAESDASVNLWYYTVCKIALGGIQDELELKTLNEGISYAMARDKFDGNLDDAIDYALRLAYDIMPVNEEAWLIALARFRLTGYGAPAWSRPAPQGRLG